MDTHRIDILHVADGDACACSVAHHLVSSSRHPARERFTSTWLIGESASPEVTVVASCSSVSQAPPVPPSVNAGRTTTGSPILATNALASRNELTVCDSGTGSPIRCSKFLKKLRDPPLS